MNNKNYFEDIHSVLGKVAVNLKLDEGLKLQEFAKLWPKIVGPRFKDKSKVISIQSKAGIKTLTIAVSSPVMAQELSFFKDDIIKKIKVVAKDFNYNIKDVIFSHRLWEENNSV